MLPISRMLMLNGLLRNAHHLSEYGKKDNRRFASSRGDRILMSMIEPYETIPRPIILSEKILDKFEMELVAIWLGDEPILSFDQLKMLHAQYPKAVLLAAGPRRKDDRESDYDKRYSYEAKRKKHRLDLLAASVIKSLGQTARRNDSLERIELVSHLCDHIVEEFNQKRKVSQPLLTGQTQRLPFGKYLTFTEVIQASNADFKPEKLAFVDFRANVTPIDIVHLHDKVECLKYLVSEKNKIRSPESLYFFQKDYAHVPFEIHMGTAAKLVSEDVRNVAKELGCPLWVEHPDGFHRVA